MKMLEIDLPVPDHTTLSGERVDCLFATSRGLERANFT